jgi:XTP/dITP diphosphohydrolase
MIELIFATNNQHKVEEVLAVAAKEIKITGLRQAGIDIDIAEPYETLQENASEKSRKIRQLTGKNCFSEDSGLEVLVLNGEPGVRSARYAGESNSSEKNIEKLLKSLGDSTNRRARFRTVISLIIEDGEHFFEGICAGAIAWAPRGKEGFGYDPVFVPEGSHLTFAEMSGAEKNIYSHRKKAVDKLLSFLQQYYGKDKH